MRGDKVIWIVTLLLGIVSLIVVYSAASALVVNKYNGSTSQMLMKHILLTALITAILPKWHGCC